MAIDKIRPKGLRELFVNGTSAKIGNEYEENALLILDHLDAITDLKDLAGVKNFHPLTGKRKGEYAMSVSGNMRIVFTWDGTDVTVQSFEDYH